MSAYEMHLKKTSCIIELITHEQNTMNIIQILSKMDLFLFYISSEETTS